MTEVEFDQLLDVVQAAISPASQEDFLITPPTFNQPPRAANDNQQVWPLIPFPNGWYASC